MAAKAKRKKTANETTRDLGMLALILRPTADARFPKDRRTKRNRSRAAQRTNAIAQAS